MSLPNTDTDRPTWKAVEDRSRQILVGMLELGVLLMTAEEDVDEEVELTSDDADEILGQLHAAWAAIHPTSDESFVEVALAVWKREKTIDEAIGF